MAGAGRCAGLPWDLYPGFPHNRAMGAQHADLSVDLVRRIHAGDDAAWEALYLRYRDPLLLSIRCRLSSKLRSRLTSEDILHSVIKDALGDLRRFEHRGPGSLGHYLHACVLNKIRNKADYHAALKRAGDVPLSDELLGVLPTPGLELEPGYVDGERFERLERALGDLPADVRELVLLRLVEGATNQEAAAIVGKTPEAASKAYCRGMARLGTLTRDGGSP